MQKLIKLSTLAVAMGLAAAAHADVTVPSLKGGFNVAVEANYLQPYGVDAVYGATVDTHQNYQNDAKMKFGYGVTVGYTMPNSANDIELSYNRYDSKQQSEAAIDVDDYFRGGSFQVKQDRYDLLLGQFINVGSNMQLHLKGGLSYAKIRYDQGFIAGFVPGHYGADTSESTFKGFGPTLGLDSTYTFGQTGFGMVAGLSTSMLVGKLDLSNGVENGTIDENGNHKAEYAHTFAQPSKSQVVPVLGAKLGLTYERSVNDAYKLGVEAGYKVDSYLNVAGYNAFSDEVQNNNSDLTIAGPYLKLKLAAC